jgi:hypothetical protein
MNITILKAYKGYVTMILKTKDYNQKICERLACGCNRKVKRDPMNKIIKKVYLVIKNYFLGDNLKKTLIPSNTIMSHIYSLPNIHKSSILLRPVNTIGSPTYELAKYLARNVKPLIGSTFLLKTQCIW